MKHLQHLVLFAFSGICMPALAQEVSTKLPERKYEVGLMPFRYHIDDQFQYENSYWQPVISGYISSYLEGSNLSFVAQLEYANKNTADACIGCTDMGDSHFNYRSLNLSLAVRQTWGQKSNQRLQGFLQPGIYTGFNRIKGYQWGGWGYSEIHDSKAFASGLDLSLGIKFMITPKIPFTATSKLMIGWEFGKHPASTTAATPLQIGLGYVF